METTTTAAAVVPLLPPPPVPDGCAICLEDYHFDNPRDNDTTTTISACVPCGHVFHTACFARYKESRPTHVVVKCPVCQQVVETSTRLYCTLTTQHYYCHTQDNDNDDDHSDGIALPEEASNTTATRDITHTTIPRSNRKRERETQDEDGRHESHGNHEPSPIHNSQTRRQVKHWKRLYRQSQRESWKWQGQYRQAVESNATYVATERQQTAQAASLVLLLQQQLQQAQSAHQEQVQQVLTIALQREEALRQAQIQLQEIQQQQQQPSSNSSNSSFLVVTPTPTPTTTMTTTTVTPTSSVWSLFPTLRGTTSAAVSSFLLPRAHHTAAWIRYHELQKDIIVQQQQQGTSAQALQQQQQQLHQLHQEYLMVVHEESLASASSATMTTTTTTTAPTLPPGTTEWLNA